MFQLFFVFSPFFKVLSCLRSEFFPQCFVLLLHVFNFIHVFVFSPLSYYTSCFFSRVSAACAFVLVLLSLSSLLSFLFTCVLFPQASPRPDCPSIYLYMQSRLCHSGVSPHTAVLLVYVSMLRVSQLPHLDNAFFSFSGLCCHQSINNVLSVSAHPATPFYSLFIPPDGLIIIISLSHFLKVKKRL